MHALIEVCTLMFVFILKNSYFLLKNIYFKICIKAFYDFMIILE